MGAVGQSYAQTVILKHIRMLFKNILFYWTILCKCYLTFESENKQI